MSTPYPNPLTAGNIPTVAAIRFGDRAAISCTETGREFTFRQVNERVNGLANALASQGIKKGDVVAFVITNRAEIIEVYFALAKLGALGIPLNYRLAPAEMLTLMQECEVVALIFENRFAELAKAANMHVAGLRLSVGIGEQSVGSAMDYEDILQGSGDEEPRVAVQPGDPQYLNLTSGTTGLPKAYFLTHNSGAVGVMMMTHLYGIMPDDVLLTVFPMFGRVGFGWAATGLYAGARNVLQNFDPQTVLGLIEQHKVTFSNWMPILANLVFQHGDPEGADLSSLRGLVFAGSPMPPSVQLELQSRLCANVYEYYGMQETGFLTAIDPQGKKDRPNSVGQVTPFTLLRVVDSEGNDMPPGEIGEIIGSTPTATDGYIRNETKSSETFRDGWVYTGDLGQLDEEGYLFITGRSKDMMITGGQNVYAVEVEDVLLSHPAVADCAVIGLPDDTWGEIVTAIMMELPGKSVSDEELKSFCREKLAGFKTPKRFIRVEEPLPRTPTGKVTKFVLVEKYAEPD